MDAIKELIRPELLVLIPVLYFIGTGLKNSSTVSDKHIPIVLGVAGILLSMIYLVSQTALTGVTEFMQVLFVGITQGVLCAGTSVYVNQIIKQSGKDDDE